MPLDDSLGVSHFWAHTVSKLLPASCVDGADPDWTGHDSSHEWSVWRDDNLWEEVANLLGF